MAKVKTKGLLELRKKLNSVFKIAINKSLRDKKLRDDVGKAIVENIRNNPNRTWLASQVTKEFREYFEQFNTTHPDYRRSKINITFTGELLNDLARNVKADTNNLALIIEHSNKSHKNYKSGGLFKPKSVQVTSLKSKKTRNVVQKKTHKEISGYVQDKGYDYLQIDDKTTKIITELIRTTVFKYLKDALKIEN